MLYKTAIEYIEREEENKKTEIPVVFLSPETCTLSYSFFQVLYPYAAP